MQNSSRMAALKAATKVAFSVALLEGCAGTDAEETTAANESAVISAGCDGCTEKLKEAFPHPGDYQWKDVTQAADVVACCSKELQAHGFASKYRWDCCVAYDPETGMHANQGHGMACTPWGPPVPPAMKRAAA